MLNDAVYICIGGLFLFSFLYSYVSSLPQAVSKYTSRATLLVDTNTSVKTVAPTVSVLPEYHPCDTEYSSPGLEIGNTWGSR